MFFFVLNNYLFFKFWSGSQPLFSAWAVGVWTVFKQHASWELWKREIWYPPEKRAEKRGWVGLDVEQWISDWQGVREMCKWPSVLKETHQSGGVCYLMSSTRWDPESEPSEWRACKKGIISVFSPVCATGQSESNVSKHPCCCPGNDRIQKSTSSQKNSQMEAPLRPGILVKLATVARANLSFKRASHRTMVFKQPSSIGIHIIVEMRTVE